MIYVQTQKKNGRNMKFCKKLGRGRRWTEEITSLFFYNKMIKNIKTA